MIFDFAKLEANFIPYKAVHPPETSSANNKHNIKIFSMFESLAKKLHHALNVRFLKLPYSCTCCPPPQNKLGGTRLKFFNAPKIFCGFRPVNEKTRLKLAHLFCGGGDSKYTNTVIVIFYFFPILCRVSKQKNF